VSWDAEEKAAEASKGADAARRRVPVRAHTLADPAPLAVAESADGARGGRDAECGAGGQGCQRSAAGGGHLVHLGHGASPGWPSGKVLDERCCTDIDYCKKNGVSLAYLPTPAAWVLPSRGGSTNLARSGIRQTSPLADPLLFRSDCH
jgi:hypothetical protein